MMKKTTAEEIDAILPQTQCGLCSFKGCMPYAESLAKQESSIDLCPPGGVPGLLAIADLLEQDPTPFIAGMQQKTKPAMRAVIREAECIGCTKCIQACPVDAILGSAKNMHTVIAAECTGCELCIEPCPVDCIDMEILPIETRHDPHYFRKRYQARQKRLEQKNTPSSPNLLNDKQSYIQAALLRAKNKAK